MVGSNLSRCGTSKAGKPAVGPLPEVGRGKRGEVSRSFPRLLPSPSGWPPFAPSGTASPPERWLRMTRLRASPMPLQGISGCRSRSPAVTRLAASPIISRSRARARAVSSSGSRAPTFLSPDSSTARRAASRMCRIRASSPGLRDPRDLLIQGLALLQDLVPEVAAEAPVGVQVYPIT